MGATRSQIVVRRVLGLFMAELRGIFKRHAGVYYRRFPDAPRPCHTCAFNPSTDRMRGADTTAVHMMNALRDGRPFFCHARLPYTKAEGWTIPTEQLRERWLTPLTQPCAGWWLVKDDPDAANAFFVAAMKSDETDPAVCGMLMR